MSDYTLIYDSVWCALHVVLFVRNGWWIDVPSDNLWRISPPQVKESLKFNLWTKHWSHVLTSNYLYSIYINLISNWDDPFPISLFPQRIQDWWNSTQAKVHPKSITNFLEGEERKSATWGLLIITKFSNVIVESESMQSKPRRFTPHVCPRRLAG